MPNDDLNTMSDLFLAALKAIGVTPTPIMYSVEDFQPRRGFLYSTSEVAAPVSLNVKMNAETLVDAIALQGPEGAAGYYGAVFGKVVAEVARVKAAE